MGPTLVAIGVGLALALPGVCARRFGSWALRGATLLVLLAIGSIALDWPREEEFRAQAALVVIAPGTVADATRTELAARLGTSPWRLIETGAGVGDAAAALAVARGDARTETALLWTQPLGSGSDAPTGVGARVFTAHVPLSFEPDALAVRALTPAVAGRPFAVELEVPVGLSGVGTLRLAAGDGIEVAARPLDVTPGAGARLDVAAPTPGAHRLELALRAGDVEVTASGAFSVAEGGRVHAVGTLAPALARALAAQGFGVDSTLEVPSTLAGIDVLILTTRLGASDAPRVRAFVLDGGGLFLVGAPDGGAVPIDGEDLASLSPVALAARPAAASPDGAGPGRPGEATSPPEQASPSPRPPEPAVGETAIASPPVPPPVAEIERRSVAMVLVVDRSASMAELVGGEGGLRRTRMDYVRSSAEATIRRLWPGDLLAIVSFGNPNSAEVVLPLTGADDLGRAYAALTQLQARPNEGTYLESALAQAGSILAPVRTPVKHVVVITDGVIADLRPTSTLRAQRLREAGATVSLIRFGAESAETMHFAVDCRTFAQLGGGQYVFSTRTTEVPALVSEEVRRVFVASGRPDPSLPPAPTANATPPAGPTAPRPDVPPPVPSPTAPPVVEAPPAALSVRALGPSPLLSPLPERGLPSVAGVLPVGARPEAHTVLVAGNMGYPLLAFSNRGLGRVGVFTSGLDAAWGSAWLAAPQFPSWFGRWIASLAPAQAAVTATNLLAETRVAPRGPTPRELRALSTWSGQPVQPVATLAPPPAQTTSRWAGTALALAIAAAASILALAALEFVLNRR